MADTPNHEYNVPDQGVQDWHNPLNENFEDFDTDIEIRDTEANLSNYDADAGAKFLATDTGVVYTGDGNSWTAQFVLPGYDDTAGEAQFGQPIVASELDLGTLRGSITGGASLTDIAGNNLSISNGQLNASGGGGGGGGISTLSGGDGIDPTSIGDGDTLSVAWGDTSDLDGSGAVDSISGSVTGGSTLTNIAGNNLSITNGQLDASTSGGGGNWTATNNLLEPSDSNIDGISIDQITSNDGFVGVGRSNRIGNEYFGIQAPIGVSEYGGMYINGADPSSWPFYGYSTDSSGEMWHYYDGATQKWHLHNGGSNRLTVQNDGNVGIGTDDPSADLEVSGTASVTGTLETDTISTDGSSPLLVETGSTSVDGIAPAIIMGHPDNLGFTVGGVIAGGGADGDSNGIGGECPTVSGGRNNTAAGDYTTVSGGRDNEVNSSSFGTVSGGEGNMVTTDHSTVGGGTDNEATGGISTIGGGGQNVTSGGLYNTVGGGVDNEASGGAATVPGGADNIASGGSASFAAGASAFAEDLGAFVWSDGTSYHTVDGNDGFSSSQQVGSSDPTGSNTFNVSATGGVRFVTGSNTVAYLDANDATWEETSTRAVKTNVDPVDPGAALEGVDSLEISKWEYETDDGDGTGKTHVGPMAEEFHDAFDVGEDGDDTTINAIDRGGVALAAIQGLSETLEEKDDRIDDLEAENDELRDRLSDLEDRVDTLDDGTVSPAEGD